MDWYQEMGVDVNQQWALANNDIILTEGTDNLYQAICNRLSCILDDMGYFYSGYGSTMKEFIGKPLNEQNLKDLAEEVAYRLTFEPRISSCEVECVKMGKSEVIINIVAYIHHNSPFIANFVLDTIANRLEYVGEGHSRIELSLFKPHCSLSDENKNIVRRGQKFTLYCRVFTLEGSPMPIGTVRFSYGGTVFVTEDVYNGIADIEYAFPSTIPFGKYTITAEFGNIGKFGSGVQTIDIEVVEVEPTETRFKQDVLYGVSNERVSYPVTVKDILGGNVTGGDVVYSISLANGEKFRSILTINDMFNTVSPQGIIFSNATVVDTFDDKIDGGTINFYIGNAEAILSRTQVLMDNTFSLDNLFQKGLFNSKVVDSRGNKVPSGKIDYYYRFMYDYLKTTTTLPDETMLVNHRDNNIPAVIVDEDGIPVQSGNIDFYLRECFRCRKADSNIKIREIFDREGNLLIDSSVLDEDDLPINKGEVEYNYSKLPPALTNLDITSLFNDDDRELISSLVTKEDGSPITMGNVEYNYKIPDLVSQAKITDFYKEGDNLLIDSEILDEDGYKLYTDGYMRYVYDMSDTPFGFRTNDTLSSKPRLAAMIVDDTGAILDAGEIITQTDENGNSVKSYISSDDVEDEEDAVKLELTLKNGEQID